MTALVTVEAGSARLALHPDMGGGIAELTSEGLPILRSWSGREEDGPFALASNVLVPFSNRIEDGFSFEGEQHKVLANRDGIAVAVHGDGFQRPWQVTSISGSSAALNLENGAIGPFRYRAQQDFELTPTELLQTLTMTNKGDRALPFGGGFHPWFPRSSETRLQFRASGYWPSREGSLRATDAPEPLPPDFDFHEMKALPSRPIDHGFDGWVGEAVIAQGADAVSVRVSSPTLTTAIVYSPGPDADFFCFEPVSHPIDAHNLPDQRGLARLAPGETLSMHLRLDWG